MKHGPLVPRFLAGPDDGKLDYYQMAGRQSGREEIVLEEDFVFRDSRGVIHIAPTGLRYDGASNPRPFWSITGHPLEARHILAGATHDQEYQTGCRLTIDPRVLASVNLDAMSPEAICALPRVEVMVDRDDADLFALYEPLMVTPGNSRLHARVYYTAVRVGGWAAWSAHVRRRASERVPFSRLHA